MRTSFILGLVLLSGCKQGLPKMPDLSEVLPKLRFKELKVKDIDFEGLDAKFVLEVDNPYPLGLSLAEKSWALSLAGSPFLDGSDTAGLDIEAAGSSPVRIPFSMAWTDALAVAKGAKGQDQIPFDLHVDLGFTTPAGPVKVPLNHSGQMPALHAPNISLKALRVESIDVLKGVASLALDVGVTSDQGSALTFEGFAYDLNLNGKKSASGTANGAQQGTFTLPIDLQLVGLGAAVVDAIKGKGQLDVGLTADADVGTPFGTVPLKINETTDLKLQ